MSRTTANLKAAFAGESQANRKYLVYAEKAERDGYPNVAKLFRAAADAETVHAIRHWRALGMARDTIKNLEDALAGETHEVETLYPGYLKQAESDEEITAQYSFKGALESEKVHMELYARALSAVRDGNDIGDFRVYTCTVCGYTHAGAGIEGCPVCTAPWAAFKEVE